MIPDRWETNAVSCVMWALTARPGAWRVNSGGAHPIDSTKLEVHRGQGGYSLQEKEEERAYTENIGHL